MSFVYKNKFGAMRNAGGAWLAMIGCLAIFFWPHAVAEPAYGHLKRLAFGYLAAPICLIIFVSFFRDFLLDKPVLLVDDHGVTVQQQPRINWADISEVRVLTKNGKKYIGMYARDIDRLAGSYPEAAVRRFKSANDLFGTIAVVAQESLSVPVDDVMAEIDAFCRSQVGVQT